MGSLEANGFGLHDMIGNMWEWCRDSYSSYGSDTAIDPHIDSVPKRVYRGGSWFDGPVAGLRCAYRNYWGSANCDDEVGVRLIFCEAP